MIPVAKDEVLKKNVQSSKIFREGRHQFIFQYGYTNVSQAYNEAIPKAQNDILIFCHQDVFLPDSFESNLLRSIHQVDRIDPNWGVLGPAGVRLKDKKILSIEYAGNFSSYILGKRFVIDFLDRNPLPRPIDNGLKSALDPQRV